MQRTHSVTRLRAVLSSAARPSRALLATAFAAALFLVALAGCGGDDGSSADAGTLNPATQMRTVEVHPTDPGPSPAPNQLTAGLEQGRLPAGEVQGTVLTDEDCAPDAQGISHCLNKVRLPDGSVVALRHSHDMHAVPCMAPGEHVLLRRA